MYNPNVRCKHKTGVRSPVQSAIPFESAPSNPSSVPSFSLSNSSIVPKSHLEIHFLDVYTARSVLFKCNGHSVVRVGLVHTINATLYNDVKGLICVSKTQEFRALLVTAFFLELLSTDGVNEQHESAERNTSTYGFSPRSTRPEISQEQHCESLTFLVAFATKMHTKSSRFPADAAKSGTFRRALSPPLATRAWRVHGEGSLPHLGCVFLASDRSKLLRVRAPQ